MRAFRQKHNLWPSLILAKTHRCRGALPVHWRGRQNAVDVSGAVARSLHASQSKGQTAAKAFAIVWPRRPSSLWPRLMRGIGKSIRNIGRRRWFGQDVEGESAG